MAPEFVRWNTEELRRKGEGGITSLLVKKRLERNAMFFKRLCYESHIGNLVKLPQLESALKAVDSVHASLESERAKSKSFLFSEKEFKTLQIQVTEMNLLRESNMQLREENKHNFEECQKLRDIAQKA